MNAAPFAPPVVATDGSTDPTAPLVVLLHMQAGPAYAAVRAPIAEGGGYARIANRGIRRPLTDSLQCTMNWFRTRLDEVAPDATGRGRPGRVDIVDVWTRDSFPTSDDAPANW